MRRVLALNLPDLACEIAALVRESEVGVAGALSLTAPLAVVLVSGSEALDPSSFKGKPLYGVTNRARRFGVCPGQTVAAARALISDLDVRRIALYQLQAALSTVADMAFSLAPGIAIGLPDTLWLDITHAAPDTLGGEQALLSELCERVRALGHRVRGAIAGGPTLAQALARFAQRPQTIVPPGYDKHSLAPLPLHALPLEENTISGLLCRGIVTVGDLSRHPNPTLLPHLGPSAEQVLGLAAGHDDTPLPAYIRAPVLVEELAWEAPVQGTEPLMFALRGLLSRVGARLEGRREVAHAIEITFDPNSSAPPAKDRMAHHEGSLSARLQSSLPSGGKSQTVRIDLPTPSMQAAEFLRAVRSTEGLFTAAASVRCVRVAALQLAAAPCLSVESCINAAPTADAFEVLLTSLASEVGEGCIGLLAPNAVLAHASQLVAVLTGASGPTTTSLHGAQGQGEQLPLLPQGSLVSQAVSNAHPPTRLLATPALFQGALKEGSFVTVQNIPFTVGKVEFVDHLREKGWWGKKPSSWDYARVWLSASHGGAEAWVVRDRRKQKLFVQGWCA